MIFPNLVRLSFVLTVLGAQPPKPPQFPPPTGPFKTGIIHVPLTDYSRHDLFAPNSFRKLMVSIYYPTHQVATHQKPYLPAILSSIFEVQHPFPNGSLHTILANAKVNAAPILHPNPQRFLFSHGGGTSRLIHTVLHEELASHGYIAISIDHPYDAAVVEFPDGTVIYRDSSPFTVDLLDKWYLQRVLDIRFINSRTANLSLLFPNPQPVQKAVLGGHSFGGAAVAGAMIGQKNTYLGGWNFDGAFWNTSISGDVQKPFFIMGGPVRIPEGDTSWDSFRAAQTGWEREVIVNGTQHWAFTDFVAAVEILGVNRSSPEIEAFVGTIEPKRAVEILRSYVRDFLDWLFGRGGGGLVNGPSVNFSEVEFIPPP